MSDVCADNIRAVLTEFGLVYKDGAFRLYKNRRCHSAVVIDLSYFRDVKALLDILDVVTKSNDKHAVFAVDLTSKDWVSPCKRNLVVTGGLTQNGFVGNILPGVMHMRLVCKKNAYAFPSYLQGMDGVIGEKSIFRHDGRGNITARFYDVAQIEREVLRLTEQSLVLDDELNCLCMMEIVSFSLPVIPSEKMLAFVQNLGGIVVDAGLNNDLYLNVGEENLVLSYCGDCKKVVTEFIGGYNG